MSPRGLLWTFVGYSTPFQIFTGAVEVLGGLFLMADFLAAPDLPRLANAIVLGRAIDARPGAILKMLWGKRRGRRG
jgi:hypothetical protein